MKMTPPVTSSDFDREYHALLTPWGDVRIPPEIIAVVGLAPSRRVLELGVRSGSILSPSRAGGAPGYRRRLLVGRYREGESARCPRRAAPRVPRRGCHRPSWGDGPFELSFDVGCFHCLDVNRQARYVSEVSRLLAPGGTHLIWALDSSPAGIHLSPTVVEKVFTPVFRLSRESFSRRRLVRSHWYWLVRSETGAATRVSGTDLA